MATDDADDADEALDDALDEVDLRILGALVEKEATVPDTYPLTLNALRSACNQTSNRDPVMDLDAGEVERALLRLKERRLVRFVHPSHGERSTKYRHVLDEAWRLDRAALAGLAVLMLRGPQTANELRTRTERYGVDGGYDAVARALADLEGGDRPLVVSLPRLPGQKEGRVMHLLAGPVDVDALAQRAAAGSQSAAASAGPRAVSGARLDEMAAEVVELRRLVEHLYRELGVDPPG